MTGKLDTRQLTLDQYFEVPPDPTPLPASFEWDQQLRGALNKAIKECALSRVQIAARMTELIFGDSETGITKAQLDAWTGASRNDWRFPLAYLPAFIEATGAYWLLDLVAAKCGCKVLKGRQALLAQYGAIALQEKWVKQRKSELQRALPKDVFEELVMLAGDKP